jgi:recombination protein RecA
LKNILKGRVKQKTSIVLESIGKEMNRDPDFIACWVESENSLDKDYICETFHIDPERFVFIPVDSGISAEEILDILYETMKTGTIDLCCINSLKALVPTQEMDASLGQAVVGTQARMNSRLTKKFNAVVAEFDTAFIMICHLTTQIGSMSRDPLVVAGGHAIQYWSSLTLDMRKRSIGPGELITKEEGVKIGVTIRKNHVMPDKFPYRKLEYYAVFGEGVETILSALNAAIEKGICTAAGAWIRWYTPDKVERNKWCGKAAFRTYMRENPEEFEEFSNLVYGGTRLSYSELEELKEENDAINKAIGATKSKKSKKSKKKSAKEEIVGAEEVKDASSEEVVG